MKKTMHKLVGALLALPLLPAVANAFTMHPASRESYNGLTPHAHWNEVWHETMLDITIFGVIFTVICIGVMLTSLRKPGQKSGSQPKLSSQAAIGWAVIPMVLFLADDLFLYVKGFDLHNHYREVPKNASEVKLTGAMWSWTYDYGNGVETYDELVVPVGSPVVIRMTSDDVVHSHYMNKYRVTEDLMPGRVTWQWMMPDEVGESVITCREYCGENHSRMFGKVRVLSQADYDAFMASEMGLDTSAEAADDVAAADSADVSES